MRYGLIGEHLSHSFSKEIHEKLGDYPYDLYPLSREDFPAFMEKRDFTGINVTIPYKEAVIPYLDHLDHKAKAIKAVNTIVEKDGLLYGTNTDFDGFYYLVQKNNISFADKVVLILGNGGAAKTVTAVARSLGAKEIVTVSRRKQDGTITYKEAEKRKDAEIIVNCSPAGMYPHTGECLVELKNYPHLTAVLDVVYNPMKTKLLLEAEKLGIPYANGLRMLVAQAKYAADFFFDTTFQDSAIEEIYRELVRDLSNVSLIGMPGSGKTGLGQVLSQALQKKFVDLDVLVEEKAGKSISQIFADEGEEGFRAREQAVVEEVSKEKGQVLSTGGGVILREDNIEHLRQNGPIILIDRPLKDLEADDKRPLARNKEAIKALYDKRISLYYQYSDKIVSNEKEFDQVIEDLKEAYDEAISD